MKKIFLVNVIFLLCLCGCSINNKIKNDGTISYMEAKEMIINDGAILVDVRSKEEYDDGHINGAILLPIDEIDEDTASDNFDSKDSNIIVYCRSGNRSSQAVTLLKNLGYTNIYDLGAMSNWKE